MNGAYQSLMNDLALTDPGGFKNFIRMTVDYFPLLAGKIQPLFARREICLRNVISVEERLAEDKLLVVVFGVIQSRKNSNEGNANQCDLYILSVPTTDVQNVIFSYSAGYRILTLLFGRIPNVKPNSTN